MKLIRTCIHTFIICKAVEYCEMLVEFQEIFQNVLLMSEVYQPKQLSNSECRGNPTSLL